MAHIKGIGMIGIVKALRSRRDAVADLLPPELHRYLQESIVVTSWYPEEDYLTLLRIYARTWPERGYAEIGRLGAREVLKGIYRNIVFGAVESAARRMKVNWRNYHDTGELSAESLPGTIRVTVTDYPVTASELCELNTGYFAELLHIAGADITATRKVHCTCRGDDSCVWEFDWRQRESAP